MLPSSPTGVRGNPLRKQVSHLADLSNDALRGTPLAQEALERARSALSLCPMSGHDTLYHELAELVHCLSGNDEMSIGAIRTRTLPSEGGSVNYGEEFGDFVRDLLGSNALPSARITNATAFCTAAAAGDVDSLRQASETMAPGAANTGDYDRRTPIHLAASEGRLEAVQVLVEELDVDVSPADRWGGTPLDDATRHGHEAARPSIWRHLKGGSRWSRCWWRK